MKKDIKYKHVVLLVGYEFRNMDKKQVYDYLNEKNIHYNNDSNIYQEGSDIMF